MKTLGKPPIGARHQLSLPRSSIGLSQLRYALRGLYGRLTQRVRCPCCPSTVRHCVDRKGPFCLYECGGCQIQFCYPSERPQRLLRFYQHRYHQAGLTTQLPTEATLHVLLESCFSGTEKDATTLIELIRAAGVPESARILDYGANWGYTVYQLRKAGFDAIGYEPSVPRAKFAWKLGVEVQTTQSFSAGSFDLVFSSHVLEHVPDALATLKEQLAMVRPGGFLVGLTPNGSAERREVAYESFHRSWGRVHPLSLTKNFLQKQLSAWPCYIASDRDAEALRSWNRSEPLRRDMTGCELVFVVFKTT